MSAGDVVAAAKKSTLSQSGAWVLDFGGAGKAAIAALALLELVEDPRLYPVPYSPAHCRHVVLWRGLMLPVLDMAVLLKESPLPHRLLAVVGYRKPGEETRFGTLLLNALPVAVKIAHASACPLPEKPDGWRQFAISCFDNQGVPTPIMHVARLFDEAVV